MLTQNWITEGWMDFEYKKYILLAYLKEVQDHFSERKLYPFLSDLLGHLRRLQQLRDHQVLMADRFPTRISKVDFEHFRVQYEKMVGDEAMMEELRQILQYAIPLMNEHLEEGRELFDFVERQLQISPVGLFPLQSGFGYLLLSEAGQPEVRAYEYEITLFEGASEPYRGIHLQYVQSYERTLSHTYEYMRTDLHLRQQKYGAPATFVMESELVFPLRETLLPIAKRVLVRHLYGQGGPA